MGSLSSALNIQVELMRIREYLVAVYSAADAQAPNATPEIHNAIDSITGALRDIKPYADAEHTAWLKDEYNRQRKES